MQWLGKAIWKKWPSHNSVIYFTWASSWGCWSLPPPVGEPWGTVSGYHHYNPWMLVLLFQIVLGSSVSMISHWTSLTGELTSSRLEECPTGCHCSWSWSQGCDSSSPHFSNVHCFTLKSSSSEQHWLWNLFPWSAWAFHSHTLPQVRDAAHACINLSWGQGIPEADPRSPEFSTYSSLVPLCKSSLTSASFWLVIPSPG